jgi:tetratricopeptide (TPR) repeat protein
MSESAAPGAPAPRVKRTYVPAVGPRLKILLYVVFALAALLGANAAYLASITALEAWTRQTYQDYFYLWMFALHVALGLLLVIPYVVFGLVHLVNTRNRKNRRAVRIGYVLFFAGVIVLVTGILLLRLEGLIDLRLPAARTSVYWLHVAAPLLAVWLYWLHRLAGPKIKWNIGLAYLGAVAGIVLAMVWLRSHDPRAWGKEGPADGLDYFRPSLVRTSDGNFIKQEVLMMDQYCQKCHQDAYEGWFHSAHHFSSFNNPAYLASVRETREVSLKRDGNVKAARWCAGCHDPAPFLGGAFDDPKYDDVNHPTAQAGITCTTCHAITHVNSTKGNADFTIEEPVHYPFAQSDNAWLQWINNQLVKAKPALHKKTFLKPEVHKSSEFCSTCHKVHLPKQLNHYKDFLRGQNHYDTFLLSGVSGHGARSFYYPPVAKENCNDCHMPLAQSNDFGAKLFAGPEKLSIHDHLFPAANTGITWLKEAAKAQAKHEEFLKDNVRVDVFGLREGGTVDGKLIAPLRPEVPRLKPGSKYLLETVIRTLKLGHPFTQGTADSNEVWLDVTVTSDGKTIGRSGEIDAQGTVDPSAHFVNVFMLDRDGNRIDRRNPQDIFTPLYNKQIPPGAAQVAHYELELPETLAAPVTIEIKLLYRKFDQAYWEYFTHGQMVRKGDLPIRGATPAQATRNPLPIITLATDSLTLPVEGSDQEPENLPSPIKETWQRWNDYGIGLLLEGSGGMRGELRQAAEAFTEVEKLGRYDGPINLARVYFREGRLDEAVEALQRAQDDPAENKPLWTISWLSGLVNRQQGHLEEAAQNFESVLGTRIPERKFDFSRDYEVINDLGQTYFDLAKAQRGSAKQRDRENYLRRAAEQFERTLVLDSENVPAHYNLALIYAQLGEKEKAEEHRAAHERYKPDDNARDRAIALARQKYPEADKASEAVVIYSLRPATDVRKETVSQSLPPSP